MFGLKKKMFHRRNKVARNFSQTRLLGKESVLSLSFKLNYVLELQFKEISNNSKNITLTYLPCIKDTSILYSKALVLICNKNRLIIF